MSRSDRIRTRRILREAEGYLELGMPDHALKNLDRITDPATFRGQALYLRGEALRALRRHREALSHLEEAADLAPSNVQIWVALGWCYKRTGRLDLAIEALEQALERDHGGGIVPYNLACYWSLAGNKERALEFLSQALAIHPDYRDMVGKERDFDPLRSDPDFQSLVSVIV